MRTSNSIDTANIDLTLCSVFFKECNSQISHHFLFLTSQKCQRHQKNAGQNCSNRAQNTTNYTHTTAVPH